MNSVLFRKIAATAIIALLGLVLLVTAVTVTIENNSRAGNASEQERHSLQVLLSAERLKLGLMNTRRDVASIALRQGTSDPTRYWKDKLNVTAQVRDLRALTIGNDSRTDVVDQTSAVLTAMYREADAVLQLAQRHPLTPEAGVIYLKPSRVHNDVALSLIDTFIASEQRLLDRSQINADAARRDMTFGLGMLALIGAFLVLIAIVGSYFGARAHRMSLQADERAKHADAVQSSEARAVERSRLLKTLNDVSQKLAAQHDLAVLVQDITDAGLNLTGARYGAFFYHVETDEGGRLDLFAISGATIEQFRAFGRPRTTPLLSAHATAVVRSDDITAHTEYGKNAPHSGMPVGHVAIRSYLAVPVVGRAGDVIGSLLFGHPEPAIFSEEHEAVMRGLAGIAAIAFDNARLYAAAQAEIDDREKTAQRLHELTQRQKLLMGELNHRVKNTLATVQSIAYQTKGATIADLDEHLVAPLDRFYEAFESRVLALSRTHDLLVRDEWSGVSLTEVISSALAPLVPDDRRSVTGESIKLGPNAAVTINMILHELATNAIKYGALSNETGRIDVVTTVAAERVDIVWRERGGPAVTSPLREGFGSKLIKRGIEREMRGRSAIRFDEGGIVVALQIPRSARVEAET